MDTVGHRQAAEPEVVFDDRPAELLDDEADREELRRRYYGLLQEMRVVLPGVQVLVAFLLTAPFAARFGRLDDLGLTTFGLAMFASLVATACLLAPTAFHRVAPRTARSARLAWGIHSLVAGLVAVAIALVSALFCVARFVYGTPLALLSCLVLSALIVAMWLAVPLSHRADV